MISVSKLRTIIKNEVIEKFQYLIYNKIYGMDIHKSVRLSTKVLLDKTNPKGVHIGSHTMITANVCVLTHDFVHRIHKDTYIGKNCFIGMNSIIMPGVKISDNVIIGAGSVVTKDIPSYVICTGNPARIIKSNVLIIEYGRIKTEITPSLSLPL